MLPPPLAGGDQGEEALCPHFGACGGCTLQGPPDADYIARKCALLETALHRAGFTDASLAPPARTAPSERRRMDLAVRRIGGRIVIGLHRQRSSDIIDMHACLVLHPTLFALLEPLRALLRRISGLKREGSLIANLLDSGPDLLLRTDGPLNVADRIALTEWARQHGLPRIACAQGKDQPEPIAILRPPTTALSGVTITPPPGAFLQASAAGEAAIIAAVLAAIPAKARVAELFAGCGSITLALAQHARVQAWEGDAAAVAVLRSAGRCEVRQRDLARQPLQAQELRGFAAIVLDPPFAGAAAQMAQIAAAKVPRVIYVNCNPATLARDARLLRHAGYRLQSAMPIDQFLWSDRLESVCVFNI